MSVHGGPRDRWCGRQPAGRRPAGGWRPAAPTARAGGGSGRTCGALSPAPGGAAGYPDCRPPRRRVLRPVLGRGVGVSPPRSRQRCRASPAAGGGGPMSRTSNSAASHFMSRQLAPERTVTRGMPRRAVCGRCLAPRLARSVRLALVASATPIPPFPEGGVHDARWCGAADTCTNRGWRMPVEIRNAAPGGCSLPSCDTFG